MMVPPATVLSLDPIPRDVVNLYIATFAPRTDLYVANGSAVVREPITPEVIDYAVKHRYPISAYMAVADDKGILRTHVSAIDFDTEDGFVTATEVAGLLSERGIPNLVFESRRGAHLWVLWGPDPEGKAPKAALAQRAMRVVIGLVGDPDNPKIEVFPKRGVDLAVGALRMPGLHHHKTQVRYPGYDMNGEKVETMESILLAFDPAPYSTLVALAGPEPQASAYPKRSNPSDSFYFTRPTHTDAPSVSTVLRGWGVENARPGITVKCPSHQDRHRSLTIFKDDERVYCGSPSCPLHGDGHGVGSIVLAGMQP